MNYSLIKIFLAVWIIENILVASHPCEVYTSHGSIEINCDTKIVIRTIPKDLPGNAVTLDISNNNLCKLFRQDFSKFKSLITLIMTNLRCVISGNISLETETFKDLHLLETLDISNSPIHANAENKFHWPKNLKLLRMIDVHHVAWDFTELRKLEIIVAMNCNKRTWPTFHPTAPLNFIDLRQNEISVVRVEQVAKFCLLSVLLINMMLHDNRLFPISLNPAPYDDFRCTCLRLQAWVHLKDIYGLEYMKCTFITEDNNVTTATLEKPCNGSFSIAENVYDSCWARNLEEIIKFYVYIIVTILVTVFIVVGLGLFLKKTFNIYKGSRTELIEGPNATDSSWMYYESNSEMEIEEDELTSISPRPQLTEPSTIKTTKSVMKPEQTGHRPTIKR